MNGRYARLLAAALLLYANPAFAPPIVVDETTCALVDAIIAANTDTASGGCPAGSGADSIWLNTDVELSEAIVQNVALPLIESAITIEGLGFTIERAFDAPPLGFFEVNGSGKLTLKDLLVSGGHHTIKNSGELTLENTTVSNDTSGFFQSPAVAGVGEITLRHSSVSDNYAGGIRGAGRLTLIDSDVSRNGGNGIQFGGDSATIANSTIADNGTALYLDAYLGAGPVEIFDSVLSGNGLGIYVIADVAPFKQSITVTNTAVTENQYGFFVDQAFVTLINSTVSGNTVSGVDAHDTDLSLTNTTVVGNTVGVHLRFEASAVSRDSIIAGNGEDCIGAISDDGGNFSGGATCGAGFAPIAPGVDFDVELSDNGGPTETHALLPESVAIDVAADCGLATDQRAQPRNDGLCDSGAYEFQCPITLDREGGSTQIFFSPESGGFDLVTGVLSDLLTDGDFIGATCLGSFPASPAVDTFANPPVGEGHYYLARGHEDCAGAGFGVSSLVPDPRDDLDTGPCP
jgi:hypothetical protein